MIATALLIFTRTMRRSAQQAQKEVTYAEGLNRLDALVRPVVQQAVRQEASDRRLGRGGRTAGSQIDGCRIGSSWPGASPDISPGVGASGS
jgi:hypothetical protein